MRVEIQPNLGFVQRECHYKCPVTNRLVTSHATRRNIMAEHNLVDANDFKPEQAIEKQRKRFEKNAELAAKLSTPIDKVLDDYRPALPTTI